MVKVLFGGKVFINFVYVWLSCFMENVFSGCVIFLCVLLFKNGC